MTVQNGIRESAAMVSTSYQPGETILAGNLAISFAGGRLSIKTLDGREPPRIKREGRQIYLTESPNSDTVKPDTASHTDRQPATRAQQMNR